MLSPLVENAVHLKIAFRSHRIRPCRERLFLNQSPPDVLYDVHLFALVAVNGAALFQYGYAEHEFLSLTLPQLTVPSTESRLKLARPRTPDSIGGSRVACTHRRKDGTFFDVEMVSRLIQWDSAGWGWRSPSISQLKSVPDAAFSED